MREAMVVPLPQDEPRMILDRTPELVGVLAAERKLIDDLASVLRQQREAVSHDDITAIDDSVFSAQRILLTLSQARTRRRTLLHVITGSEEVALGDFEGLLGPAATHTVLEARDALQASAQNMAHELQMNRRVLSGAIDAGDQLLRTLTGGNQKPTSYTPRPPSGDDGSGASGFLIDTQV